MAKDNTSNSETILDRCVQGILTIWNVVSKYDASRIWYNMMVQYDAIFTNAKPASWEIASQLVGVHRNTSGNFTTGIVISQQHRFGLPQFRRMRRNLWLTVSRNVKPADLVVKTDLSGRRRKTRIEKCMPMDRFIETYPNRARISDCSALQFEPRRSSGGCWHLLGGCWHLLTQSLKGKSCYNETIKIDKAIMEINMMCFCGRYARTHLLRLETIRIGVSWVSLGLQHTLTTIGSSQNFWYVMGCQLFKIAGNCAKEDAVETYRHYLKRTTVYCA